MVLGTGPPDPTLESPSPPQGSIWHRCGIDSSSIRHRFPEIWPYFRCQIRMHSFNFHYRYRLGVRSHTFTSIDSQLPPWKSFELTSQIIVTVTVLKCFWIRKVIMSNMTVASVDLCNFSFICVKIRWNHPWPLEFPPLTSIKIRYFCFGWITKGFQQLTPNFASRYVVCWLSAVHPLDQID